MSGASSLDVISRLSEGSRVGEGMSPQRYKERSVGSLRIVRTKLHDTPWITGAPAISLRLQDRRHHKYVDGRYNEV